MFSSFIICFLCCPEPFYSFLFLSLVKNDNNKILLDRDCSRTSSGRMIAKFSRQTPSHLASFEWVAPSSRSKIGFFAPAQLTQQRVSRRSVCPRRILDIFDGARLEERERERRKTAFRKRTQDIDGHGREGKEGATPCYEISFFPKP